MKEETFKNKILWYNFVLCILVVCIHAQNMYIFIEPVGWINHSISFLIDKIACLAVPSFFMCSGYLFYRNFTWEKISVKLKRRFFSLVVPFLLWNLLYYILHLVARKIPYVSQLFDTDVPFSLKELADAVFLYKYNPVFWFMSYLIIFSFLCPVIYGLLKQKWVGLLVVLSVFALNVSAVFVPYLPVKANDILWWSSYYLIGSYISIHWKEAATPKKTLIYKCVIVSLVSLCISYVLFFVYNQSGWNYIYKLCGAIFLWYFIWMIGLPDAKKWMKNTFFIYAVHQIMALFLNKMANVFLGNSMYVGGFVFLLIPVIVVVFCYYAEILLSKYLPIVWKGVSGGR